MLLWTNVRFIELRKLCQNWINNVFVLKMSIQQSIELISICPRVPGSSFPFEVVLAKMSVSSFFI